MWQQKHHFHHFCQCISCHSISPYLISPIAQFFFLSLPWSRCFHWCYRSYFRFIFHAKPFFNFSIVTIYNFTIDSTCTSGQITPLYICYHHILLIYSFFHHSFCFCLPLQCQLIFCHRSCYHFLQSIFCWLCHLHCLCLLFLFSLPSGWWRYREEAWLQRWQQDAFISIIRGEIHSLLSLYLIPLHYVWFIDGTAKRG